MYPPRKSSGNLDPNGSVSDFSNSEIVQEAPSPKVQTSEDLEEIRLWVESRKKNFPSKERVE